MDQFRILSALLNDSLNVELWLSDEIIDGLNTAKYTVFIFVFVNAQVWFSWNQESILVYQTPNTKA